MNIRKKDNKNEIKELILILFTTLMRLFLAVYQIGKEKVYEY